MKRSLFFLATTLAFHASALAQTKVPSLINYQGYVANSAGAPLGATTSVNRTVTFRFWKSASATDAASRLYSESQTVTILDGDFSVLIGNGAVVVGEPKTITVAEVFANKEVFLGITVDDGNPATTDAEISPRQQLVSTAFAFRASVAETVDAGAISNAMLSANAVKTAQLSASSVTLEKMAASSVDSSHIVDGTITSFDIGTNAVASDEIAENAVGASEIAASAVGTSEIADGAVAMIDIANDAITADKIAASAVGTSEISDGKIATIDIADDAITAAKIAKDAVGASEIGANAVAADEIAANAVDSSKLADGAVTSAKLGTNTMHASENLKIIRGIVAANGTITAGVGFTVTKTGTGAYLLDFTPDFTGIPNVAITGPASGLTSLVFVGGCTLVSSDTNARSRVNVQTYLQVFSPVVPTPSQADLGFSFTAIGPR